MPGDQNSIVFITGKKGCGKTTIAQRILDRLALAGRRIVCIDPTAGMDVPGARVLPAADPAALLFECSHSKGRNLLLRPENEETPAALLNFAWEVGDCWLFVDEVDIYFPPARPNRSLLSIIRYGRHRGISTCAISQRPASIRKDLIAMSDIRILFCTDEPNDSLYLRKLCAVDPLALRSLTIGKFLLQKS